MSLLSRFVPTVRKVSVLNVVTYSLSFPLSLPKKKLKDMASQTTCSCGKGFPMPSELSRIKSMDEWGEMPREFRQKFSPYIEEEFRRRREGFWFFNAGRPTYITGRHYMMLQWTKIDIGHPSYLAFQRDIFLHMAACEADPDAWVSYTLSVGGADTPISALPSC